MLNRRALLGGAGSIAGLALIQPVTGKVMGRAAARQRLIPLPQPPERRSVDGMLATELRVAFSERTVEGLDRPITTRMYEGAIPGPTLRVRPGDTMLLTQVNDLPPNPDQTGEHDHNIPHHFNTFNLHTHGLHVSPEGNADNVLRSFTPFDPDNDLFENSYLSEIMIPENHEPGTYWYHPHFHGATTMQLSSGMAGVLIIEGAVDEVPEIAAADDIVMCINELKLDEAGRVPDFVSADSLFLTPSTFLVNGELNPTLRVRPGQVQRWRLLNAGAFSAMDLSLEGHALHQIAQDGLTFDHTQPKLSVNLAMGNRADVMVQAGDPGQYRIMAGDRTMMTLEVAGEPIEMNLPSHLPGTPTLAPIGTDDLTPTGPHGNGRRTVIFSTAENALEGEFSTAYRMIGDGATPSGEADGRPDSRYGRFDPHFINHTLHVGDVEEWTIRNELEHDHSEHPFHLHTNPILVVSLDGEELSPPVWQDTINPTTEAVIRLRVSEFTGLTVLHCHNLEHEDLGMMQLVDYLPPREADPILDLDIDLDLDLELPG